MGRVSLFLLGGEVDFFLDSDVGTVKSGGEYPCYETDFLDFHPNGLQVGNCSKLDTVSIDFCIPVFFTPVFQSHSQGPCQLQPSR